MRQKTAGFTLMEVMITVAIVAILAAVALASYRSQIVRSNRSAAESFMQEVAGKEERYLLDNRQYASGANALKTLFNSATDPTPSNGSGTYKVSVADDSATGPGYKITASPIGSQQTDDTACGSVTLDSKGTKGQSGSGTRCW